MDFNLIYRTYDKDLINSVVKPLIIDVVEDDTIDDCFDLDVNKDCWLSCEIDGDFKGLFHVKAFNRTTLDLHCYVLKSKRKHSKECGKMAINWINESAPKMYKKIITQAPSIYPHIKKYVLSLGFELEGTYKNSFTKNGKVWDLWLFGLNRG